MEELRKAYRAVQEAQCNLDQVAKATFPPGTEVRWESVGKGAIGEVVKHLPGWRVMVANKLNGNIQRVSLWRLEINGEKIADLFK